MADYWGARIFYTEGQNGEGSRYLDDFSPGENYEPTERAGPDNGTTIEQVRQQILNQHPEDISALADQWQNAYNLLSSMRDQLLGQSQTLYDESWQSSAAKDLFMERGPGKTLIYLDEWMTAAEANRDAARGMVGIATDSRSRMETLWSEYEAAVDAAHNVSGGEEFKQWVMHYNLVSWEWKRGTLGIPYLDIDFGDDEEYQQALDGYRADQVGQVHEEYNRRAQELAVEVASSYFDYLTASGHGPPFAPMNAVLNTPGQGFWAGLPPGGMPGLPPGVAPGPPPGVNPGLAPGSPPVPLLAGPMAPVAAFRAQPLVAPTASAPDLPAGPPAAPGDATAPVGATAPTVQPPPAPVGIGAGAGAGVLAGMIVPPPPLGAAGGTTAAATGTPGAPPAAANLAANAAAPAALRNGVLQGPAALSRPAVVPPGAGFPTAAVPPGGLSPAAVPPPPPAAMSRTPPGRQPAREAGPMAPGQAGSAGAARVEGPFSGPPPSTAPPVLNNPAQRQQRRPGSPEELLPPSAGGDQRPGTPGTARPAPPVLTSPAQQPVRPVPALPGQPGRPAPGQRGAAGRPHRPDTDWVGADEVRPHLSTPVLHRPAAPLTGSAVSRLEEVPAHLRGRPSQRVTGTGARTDGTVAPEVTARRASRERDPAGTGAAVNEPQVVTGEQAFTVETPGGGVLAPRPEDKSYRPEPPTVLSGQ